MDNSRQVIGGVVNLSGQDDDLQDSIIISLCLALRLVSHVCMTVPGTAAILKVLVMLTF